MGVFQMDFSYTKGSDPISGYIELNYTGSYDAYCVTVYDIYYYSQPRGSQELAVAFYTNANDLFRCDYGNRKYYENGKEKDCNIRSHNYSSDPNGDHFIELFTFGSSRDSITNLSPNADVTGYWDSRWDDGSVFSNLYDYFHRSQDIPLYIGVNGRAREVTDMYVGVNGRARKVTAIYVGVNGRAREVFKAT